MPFIIYCGLFKGRERLEFEQLLFKLSRIIRAAHIKSFVRWHSNTTTTVTHRTSNEHRSQSISHSRTTRASRLHFVIIGKLVIRRRRRTSTSPTSDFTATNDGFSIGSYWINWKSFYRLMCLYLCFVYIIYVLNSRY